MSQRQADGLLHGLQRLALVEADALSDAQLLRRFATDRDAGAFSVLVRRHGRLVHGVCRNILRHEQDAEDAAQGTFLVLARRAGAIREGEAVGGWLYRVAYRVATKARTAAERRRKREAKVARPDVARPAADLAWRDLQAILDEELNRLPARLRTPFVLCCLAGKSKSEAAAELGWKEGTVSSRLAHARERLRIRLGRRGVALSAILSGLAVADQGTATPVPADLIAAAQAFAAGEPLKTAPAALARAFLKGITVARLQFAAGILVLLGVTGTLAATAFRTPPDIPAAVTSPDEPDVAVVPGPELKKDPAADRPMMTVTGTVMGPDGKAVPGARIAVLVRRRLGPGETTITRPNEMEFLGAGEPRPTGDFVLSVPQTTLDHLRITTFVKAPGHALAVIARDDAAFVRMSVHDFRRINLVRGRPARGRLVDPAGNPVAGVTLHLLGIERRTPSHSGYFALNPPVPVPGWPDRIVTDADGVFTVDDQVQGTELKLQVRDQRFATDWIVFKVGPEGSVPTFRLAPPRMLTGQVTAADTGEPIAGAVVAVQSRWNEGGKPATLLTARTGRDGRYTVRPFPVVNQTISVYPPAGVPYLGVEEKLSWPGAAAGHNANVALPRGVLVRGKVVEEGTGKPVSGAGIGYSSTQKGNPPRNSTKLLQGRFFDARQVATAADGSFVLAAPPGPGNLLVKANEPEFILQETSGMELRGEGRGGPPYFVHALVPLSLDAAAPPKELKISLRRGITIRGHAVRPDGTPSHAFVVSPTFIPRGTEFEGVPIWANDDGRFEVPGCRLGETVPLWFIDLLANGKNGAGAMVKLKADPNTEPVVRMTPLVSARIQCVNEKTGTAMKGYEDQAFASLEVRPGVAQSQSYMDRSRPPALHAYATTIYGAYTQPIVEGDGKLLFRYLVPGATYQLHIRNQYGVTPAVTFTAPQVGVADLKTVKLLPPPKPDD